ncbi:hypothetical protein EDM54_24295 [Brevibacillus borstelensis]|uniref:hypothetical protein n=1 Tax=Brevibacillus borstelensis TaxID=45462 RepID=UPI000F080920|nr:hypothetical protein [Brevibacillus borstelensis]MED1882001.1 hypothetical protein [Brevibacillus borstelensis]MED2007011.1 hypothetical protein [Brevibacillus borstelensis]RNB56113.1 hypothetical protein EDM54_24295 [Brevibacillus borstelensis]GED55563.1 hypothetical protein BBO01nite_48040 [Brevibacillus borstelensis]
MLVKFVGANASLQAYGYRFEKDKLVRVDDTKVLAKLKERKDFELLEEVKPVNRKKGEGKPEEGGVNADTGESKAAE